MAHDAPCVTDASASPADAIPYYVSGAMRDASGMRQALPIAGALRHRCAMQREGMAYGIALWRQALRHRCTMQWGMFGLTPWGKNGSILAIRTVGPWPVPRGQNPSTAHAYTLLYGQKEVTIADRGTWVIPRGRSLRYPDPCPPVQDG